MRNILCSLLLFLIPLGASAYDFRVDGIYYNVTSETDKTCEVTYLVFGTSSNSSAYTGAVVIPSSVEYGGTTYSVTSIGESAFCLCSDLTSVTIPSSVTSIGRSAFDGCSSLTSVTIPESVTSIGCDAFKDCPNMQAFYVDENSLYFTSENGLLYNADKTALLAVPGKTSSVNIPFTVTSIGDYAFSCCLNLSSVTIPSSVKSIGDYAFSSCPGLTSVTIPGSVTSIGQGAFNSCSGLTSVAIPDFVTSIGDCAFEWCTGLTSVTIPESVTSIGFAAFRYCSSLTTLIIGSSVKSIDAQAFTSCSNLTSVTIPSSVTSIGCDAFKDCSNMQAFYVDENSLYFTSENGVLFNADKTVLLAVPAKKSSVTIPSSVESIGASAFYRCFGLTSLTIPYSVKSIGEYAFSGCSGLTSLTIPGSVESIGRSAFAGCSGLTSLTIPASVTSISDATFHGCSGLTSLTIGSSVTSIGRFAFWYCSSLTSLTIPNSVKSIDYNAFAACSGLKRLECLAEVPPTCNGSTFYDFDTDNCELMVLESSIEAYRTAEVWKEFPNIVSMTYDVAIDELCYVTRCFPCNVDLTGSGLTAYVVNTYDDATAMLTEVTGVVPSGTGVLLYAATPGSYNLTATAAFATDANLSENKLVGVLVDTELQSGEAYVLAEDGAGSVEFALLSDEAGSNGGNVVPAHRAYLPVNASASAAPQTLSFSFGTPTGIDRATLDGDDADVTWYTLGGVAVKNPSKGIFVNSKGKVVLFK